jgi:hypothetical protein
MSLSFEDWLKEKHSEVSAEERAKLVEEHTNFMDETTKSFEFLGKMPSRRALEVFAVLTGEQLAKQSDKNRLLQREFFEEEGRRLTSRRQLIGMMADGYVKGSGLSREEAEEKAEQKLAEPPVKDKDEVD